MDRWGWKRQAKFVFVQWAGYMYLHVYNMVQTRIRTYRPTIHTDATHTSRPRPNTLVQTHTHTSTPSYTDPQDIAAVLSQLARWRLRHTHTCTHTHTHTLSSVSVSVTVRVCLVFACVCLSPDRSLYVSKTKSPSPPSVFSP